MIVNKLERLVNCTDGKETQSSLIQDETEQDCFRFYSTLKLDSARPQLISSGFINATSEKPQLLREKTIAYLRKGLETPLGMSYTSLDASRPWLIYWMLHSLELLDAFPQDLIDSIRRALQTCMVSSGGFGGGFMQSAHTAATYASVLAICTLGDVESFQLIDRVAVYKFLMSIKDKETGAFRVQLDGEMDTRGLYTVLAVASILHLLTPELVEGCAEFVGKCQTYEGGIGGEPGNEAHGGYAFCGIAALAILDRWDVIDVDAFVDWICARQMRMEGGFQGRTNKLVDSCYSYWQGATPAILAKYLGIKATALMEEIPSDLQDELDAGELVIAQARLQQYILLCCQFHEGGLRDKPGKPRDQYHTCYSLSGLSVSQNAGALWGDESSLLKKVHPVYNVEESKLERAMQYFSTQPPVIHAHVFPA